MKDLNPLTIKEIALKVAFQEAKEKDLDAVVFDRAQDRHFCNDVGIDYCDRDVYTQIKDMLLQYKKAHV